MHSIAQNLIRLLWVVVVAVTGGFVWTVGQTGLKQTNNNLCELWRSLPLPDYRTCEFQQALVFIWLLAAVLGTIYIFFELYVWIGHFRKRSARLLFHWVLVVFFVIGSAISIILLVKEWKNSPAGNDDEQHAAVIAPTSSIPEPQRAPVNQIQPMPIDGPIFWAPASISEIVQVENSPINNDPMVTVIKMYSAKNISPEPLTNVKAYVTPELAGKDLAMVFYDPHQDVSNKTVILPGDEFDLYYDLRPTTKDQRGVSFSDYLKTYGGIRIRVETNGRVVFHRDFSYSEIKKMLAAKQDEYLAKKRLP
jgi:hypothetical protein